MEYLYELVGGVLIFFSSFVGEQLQHPWKRRTYFFFGILSLGYVGVGVWIRHNASTREKRAEEQVELLQESLKGTNADLRTTREDLAAAQKVALQKSDEIQRMQQSVLSHVTGGETFGYFTLMWVTNDSVDFGFHVKGETPLYDAFANITDVNRFHDLWRQYGLPEEAMENSPGQVWWGEFNSDTAAKVFYESRSTVTLGSLGPNSVATVWKGPAPKGNDERYAISTWARNCVIHQVLLLQRTPKGWSWATKVEQSLYANWRAQPKVVYKFKTPDFPRANLTWK